MFFLSLFRIPILTVTIKIFGNYAYHQALWEIFFKYLKMNCSKNVGSFCPSENKPFWTAELSKWHRICPSKYVFFVRLSLEPFCENVLRWIKYVQTSLKNILNIT